jgi:hypothetical protein
VNMFLFFLVWLIAALLPLAEAATLMKRMGPRAKLKSPMPIIVAAIALSAGTLATGIWLATLTSSLDARQQEVLWSCATLPLFFHAGVLIMAIFFNHIMRWYISRTGISLRVREQPKDDQ